ncbi:MAG: hypothetical protein HY903_22785 [Deltaproteobacteria bacterium]|nr:hypothetical protein [Deltaproteobacteria bacterium]
MRRFALFAAVVLGATACDWDQFALLNSIPVHGKPGSNSVVRVYLGIDGLSYATVEAVIGMQAEIRRGFEADWHKSRFVSMFPATSDASWSRILHAERIGGYEYEYYDPTEDQIINKGYLGLVNHAVPAMEGTSIEAPPYYSAFDYYADGYLDTVWTYQSTEMSFADALDSFFFLLATKSELAPVFAGYMPELDVMGHMQTKEMVEESFVVLMRRIAEFKRRHPERTYLFTVFSDHALDFIPAKDDELVDFAEVMTANGVTPVLSFAAGRKAGGAWAIPIIHTRVSYLALHTDAELAEDVAARLSSSPTVDFSIARAAPPLELDPDGRLEWVALWKGGEAALTFGYDATTDSYTLPADGDYEGFDVPVSFGGADFAVYSDQELFTLTLDRAYPDLFERARTGIRPVSVRYPAQVLVSFRRPYASRGFEIPGGANEIAGSGFHGGMEAAGSVGVIISEERDLPAGVRSENLLELFPSLETHMRDRGVHVTAGDVGAGLDYEALPYDGGT